MNNYEVAVTVYVQVYAEDAIEAELEALHIVKQMVECGDDFVPEHAEDDGTGVEVRGYPTTFRDGREVVYTKISSDGTHEELGSSDEYIPRSSLPIPEYK